MNDQTNDAAGQGEQAECHHCNDLESLRAELAQLKSRDGDTQNRLNELLDTVQKLEAGRDQLKEQLLNNALMAEQQAKELRAQLAMAEDAAKKGDLARQNAAGMEMEIGEFMAQLEGYREILKSVTAMDDWNLPDAKFRQAVMDNWNDLESDNTDLAKQNEALRKDGERLLTLAKLVWETRWVSDDAKYQDVVGIAAEINSGNFDGIDKALASYATD